MQILNLFLFATLLSISPMEKPETKSIYNFIVPDLNGGSINFADYQGKMIMIVNTASECGYTPQYAQLEELYKTHKDSLVIVGFPANNFGGQEPGSNETIYAFCQKNYGVSFPMAEKVSVKGVDKNELFAWLIAEENPDFVGEIEWNFEKFLLDKDGKLVRRFRSAVEPLSEEVLNAL